MFILNVLFVIELIGIIISIGLIELHYKIIGLTLTLFLFVISNFCFIYINKYVRVNKEELILFILLMFLMFAVLAQWV